MFHSARIKLTAWYLVIIMIVSLLFSLAIYTGIDRELGRFERSREAREERIRIALGEVEDGPKIPPFDPAIINEARTRLIFTLGFINLGILIVSGALGYILAGVTLRPIGQMLDEQNRFITDASHELRTPLTALKSEIEVSLRDKKLSARDARNLLSSNLEEVDKLQELSDSLIRLTQYQGKNNDLNLERISILKIVSVAKQKVAGMAKAKNIFIDSKLGATAVNADTQSLAEFFVILLDNAIKYSPRGSTVKIFSKVTDGNLLVSVKDSGMGIEKADIGHLFNRFFRTKKVKDRSEAGYGLGLSIAEQIAKKHNGIILVESEVGKGSTFSLKIPRA